jgi:hypothetical protein
MFAIACCNKSVCENNQVKMHYNIQDVQTSLAFHYSNPGTMVR